jgi:hypothetical protein
VELEFETIEFPAGGFLNQDCAFSFVLESMLLATHRKIPFSTASTHNGHRGGIQIKALDDMECREPYRVASGVPTSSENA